MQSPHIVRKTTSPVSAPPEAGIHWINTSTGEEYFSVGTVSVNDWIIRKNNGTWLNGSGVPSAGLGNENDNYIDNVSGDYYKKISGVWVLQGNLQGPTGATGPTGPTGPAGANGADGSQIYVGAGAPSALLGQDSDFYIDSVSNTFYQKVSGAWVMQGSFGGVTDHGMLTGLADNDHPQYLLEATYDFNNNAQKEPTGFENRTDSSISFDDLSRTLFISATGASFNIWVKGNQYTFLSGLAIGKQISNTTGLHYIYFDSAGNIQETSTFSPSLFTDNAMIAIVYWNATTGSHVYFSEERHGIQMDGSTQAYLHTVFGTRYLTGLALQGFDPDGSGNVNSNAQFSSDTGSIRDEDLLHTLAAQSTFPVLYRDGTAWKKKALDSYPLIYNGTVGYTGTRIAYNNFSAGNWSLAEVTDGNYILMHFFATNDIDNPVVAILGTTQYANGPQARAGADTEIGTLSGLPFAEFTAIGSVIFQTQSSYTNVPKARVVSSDAAIGETYVDYRGEQLYTPSGVATSHSLLSNLDADDHLQYHNDTRGDARYVKLTGGTMSGSLVVSGAAGTGSAMMRVTNTGLGDSFIVEDSANPDASNFKIDSSGFIYTGSLLSSIGSSGRMQILDLSNAFVECIAGSTRAVSFGASTTGNGFRSAMGPMDISTTQSADGITITPAAEDGFGSAIYCKSNGSALVTGINNATPTEALDVTGNIKASGTLAGSNLSGTNTGDETNATIKTKLGAASTSTDGYLTSTNWNTFNNKQATITGAASTVTTSNLTAGRAAVSNGFGKLDVSITSDLELEYVSGVTSPIQTQLNGKEPTLTKGNLTSSTTGVTVTGGTGSVIGSGTTVNIQTASGSQPGLLSSTDWNTFNDSSTAIAMKLPYAASLNYVIPVIANTAPSVIGCVAPSVTGTASAVTPSGTSYYTTRKILEITASSLTTAIAGWRWATEYFFMGNTATSGGIKFSTKFGFQAGFAATQSARTYFCGFTSSTVAPSSGNPSVLGATQEMFGIGFDSNDANMQFMHSNGTANATKIDLGSSFIRPTADKADFYQIEYTVVPNSGTVNYFIKHMITGATASGSVSTNLPANTSALSPRCWVAAGGTASAVGLGYEYIYILGGE